MGLKFKDQNLGECFFVTTSFHQHQRFGDTPGVYQALGESLNFCLEKYGVCLPGYVFMPTHIHLLLIIGGRFLSDFMRDFKKFVAQKGLPDCGVVSPRIWQSRYDRVVVYTETQFRRKMEYIHRNPVKAGLAADEGAWLWSSSRCYTSESESPVPIWKGWLF
jgi:putative transposase